MAFSGRDGLAQALDRANRFASSRKTARIARRPFRMLFPEMLTSLGRTRPTRATTFWGGSIDIVLPDTVSKALYRYGMVEYELSRYLISALPSGAIFFDVGAHLGYVTRLAAELVGPQGIVVAFEPTPATFSLLAQNTWSLPNVHAVNAAVWSENGTIELHDYGPAHASFNSAFSPRVTISAGTGPRAIEVPSVSIDDQVNRVGLKPDFVKLDVESAELKALQGMQHCLRSIRPVVILEVGDVGVSDAPSSATVIQYLLGFDYEPFELSAGDLTPHKVTGTYDYTNLVFLPNEWRPRDPVPATT